MLKSRDQWKLIGQPVVRRDIPSKVDGSAIYGIDFTLPDMRVATIAAAPVRGGKLESVDEAPALAVKGVEKVVKLPDAVIVVAKGYWQAKKGLEALSPTFSDGGHAAVSTPAIYAAQGKLMAGGKLTPKAVRATSMALSARLARSWSRPSTACPSSTTP